MKLDEKKLAETCRTVLSSADLFTITEKKIRRQVEDELGLEDKILDKEPHKSYVKEIVNKVIDDLRESSRSPPQTAQTKKTNPEVSKTIKSASTTKKQRKVEIKSKGSSKAFDNVSPLNGKAQIEISKTSGESLKATSREEQSKKLEDISKVDDYKSSSRLKSNTSKPSEQTGQADNEFKEAELTPSPEVSESEKLALPTRTTKSTETNKAKRKPRSRIKRNLSPSSDTNKNSKKGDLALISTAKGGNSEEPALPTTKRTKKIKITLSDEDEEHSDKEYVNEKVNEKKQISRKVCAVKDGGSIMATENELLAQSSDAVRSKNLIGLSGNDVESDNTIKEEDEGIVLDGIPEVNCAPQNSLKESASEAEQELSVSKALLASPKGVIDDEDDLSSLEDVEPRKKKLKTGKASAKTASNKTANNKTTSSKTANSKTTSNKTANSKTAKDKTTVERDDQRIKNLKSLIVKCGVRKNWAKELADCHTHSSKINRLKQILTDLGIEGRPTLEKCKKVKKRLELEAELKAMDVDNIISDDVKESRKARASRGILRRRTQPIPEYDDASSSSEDKHSDFESH